MHVTRTVGLIVAELRQALRRLSWSPGFAALAIGILTVGVGTNAAMFGLVDALLLRPPNHVAEPASVVRVQFRPRGEPSLLTRTYYSAFADLRASGAFAAVAAYAEASGSMGAGQDATLLNLLRVSREFFQVLGPRPRLGSFASVNSGATDSGDWAIVSHGFWLRRFGGEPNAVGAKLAIDAKVYTIVGVAPDGFPSLSARRVDVWLPLTHAPAADAAPGSARGNRERPSLFVLARLAPGTSRRSAEQRAASTLQSRNAGTEDSDDAPWEALTASIVPGRDARLPLESKVSFWLAGVSAILLLIACANVSNLVLTRALAERRELYIRLALGASRWHLLLRSLADTSTIVVPGALGALVVSFLLRNALAGYVPGDVPVSRDLWDTRTAAILIGSAGLALVSIHAASLLGLHGISRDKESLVPAAKGKHINMRPRRVLLAIQAGLSLALLFVAGLFATSLGRAESLDLGAELDHTIQLAINLAPRHRVPAEVQAIYEQALEMLTRHPGVERAALAAGSPFMSGSGVGPRPAGRSFDELWANRSEVAYRSVVGAGFFSTVGSRSLRGRDFSEADRLGAPLVAIVNAPLARYLWPSEDPVGQCMWLDDAPACVQVVGVLGGVWKFKALERSRMAVYLPIGQVPDATPGALYVRPRGDARAFLPQALSIVQNVRPDLPAARGVVLREVVDPEFRPWQLGTTVFSAFAVVALLITSIGLYGIVAASTMVRMKEIGIRLALGARWPHVIKAIVGESVISVASGLIGGVVLVAVGSRWLTAVLFQTSPAEPAVVIQTAFILLMVSALAVTVPTIRALRANPTDVLRTE